MNTETQESRPCGRSDPATAAIIDMAIGRLDQLGPREVARLLAANGVGFKVTVRVVAEATRRRTPAPQ